MQLRFQTEKFIATYPFETEKCWFVRLVVTATTLLVGYDEAHIMFT